MKKILLFKIVLSSPENLAESSSQFRVSSRRLERKMWWKSCRVSAVSSSVVKYVDMGNLYYLQCTCTCTYPEP